jgi:hypothetical protein
MTWLRFLNNQYQAVKDLVVGDGTAGTKSLKFDNGAISEIEIPEDIVSRKWKLPKKNGEIALISSVKAELFNHFIANISVFISSVAGTGASTSFNTNPNLDTGGHPGIIALSTGSTASGRVYIGTSITGSNTLPFQLGYGTCKIETVIKLNSLSTSTETYTFRFGFMNTFGVEPTNGVYVRYTHSINNGSWQFVSRVNNIEQILNTSIAANTDWKKFSIDITSDASESKLFIDDIFIGTLSNLSGIAQSGRQVGGGFFILKSLGTASVTCLSDYLYIGINLD